MDLLAKMATYVRVIEAGSLSGAAKQLRISAAAVSRQIATLEAQLGAPLLLRTTRRMTVTPAGRRSYYERCLRILREVDDAQAIGRGAGLEGTLRMNAPITFGLACLVPQMPAFMAKYPRLRIDLQVEDRVIDLVLDGVDVAIRVGGAPPQSTEIIAHRLLAFRRVVVAAPAYVRRRGEPKTPEALAKHDVLTHVADRDQWTLTRAEEPSHVGIHVVFRSNALHALRELAVRGSA